MAAAPPAWVAALPSDDDDEVDDELQLPVASKAVARTDCYILEDDDVQVVNVIKQEDQRRQRRVVKAVAGQHLNSKQQSGNLAWAGVHRFDVRVGEVHPFVASRQEQMVLSPKKRKRNEAHHCKRIRTSNFDVRAARGAVDGDTFHLGTEILGHGSVAQFRGQQTRAGGVGSHCGERGFPTAGEPQLEFRTQVFGRGASSAPAHHGYPYENRAVQDLYSNGGGQQPREYGVLGGGPASQVRERQTVGSGFPLQRWEQRLVPEREHSFTAIGRERLVSSQGLIHGSFVERENLDIRVWASDPRVPGLLGKGAVTTPGSLERIVTGKTMNEWCSSLRESVGTNLSGLHRDIVSFCKSYELTPEQTQLRKEALEYVEKTVHELWPSAEVHLFGSTATGLALPWSDIDVAVLFPQQRIVGQKSATISRLSELGRHFKRHGQCKSQRQISHSKVPLLKLIFKSGLACDISIDSHNGPRGVPVIRQFMQQYEALHPLCLVLKFFLGQKNLNELWTGGLGSFCLITMVVSHLQKLEVTGTGNDLGVLLLSFFTRYSSMHNYRTDVVSTRAECWISKQAKGWVNLKDPELLSVEDPLDPTSDIAKGSFKIKDVRSMFLKAKSSLLANWHHDNVLGKLVDTTGNPNHRPKVSVEKVQLNIQRKQGKRKKPEVRSEMVDGQPVQIRKKQKTHGKHGGSSVTAKKSKKQKNGTKKKKKDKGVRKESQVERTLMNFWESLSNPRKGSKGQSYQMSHP